MTLKIIEFYWVKITLLVSPHHHHKTITIIIIKTIILTAKCLQQPDLPIFLFPKFFLKVISIEKLYLVECIAN